MKTYKPNDTARIQALRFVAHNIFEAEQWAGEDLACETVSRDNDGFDRYAWTVKTLEGWVDLPIGHYLIKGINQEFYPCDPEVFEKRWVEVE